MHKLCKLTKLTFITKTKITSTTADVHFVPDSLFGAQVTMSKHATAQKKENGNNNKELTNTDPETPMQLEKQGHDEIIWQLLKFAVYNKTKFLKCITQKKL